MTIGRVLGFVALMMGLTWVLMVYLPPSSRR